MRKNNLFEEYTTPELEVISTVVEQGFTVSNGVEFETASEFNYGEDF